MTRRQMLQRQNTANQLSFHRSEALNSRASVRMSRMSRMSRMASQRSVLQNMPTERELIKKVKVATEEAQTDLNLQKSLWYKRRFRLWVPLKQKFDVEEEDQRVMVEMLPVEEMLNHITLKDLRRGNVTHFLLYVVFMVCYSTSLVMQRSLADAYTLESALVQRMTAIEGPGGVTFNDINDVPSLWTWLEGPFLDLSFPNDNWYNGDPVEKLGPDEMGYIFMYNAPVAGFDLVQHRVQAADACVLNPHFCKAYPEAYFDLWAETSTASSLREDKLPFGPDWDPVKYTWRKDQSGEFGGGAYMVHFPVERRRSVRMIQELKKDLWLDKHTRDIQASLTTFNANLRLFAISRFKISMNAAGSLTKSLSIASLRLDMFRTAEDWTRVALEIIALLCVMGQSYYTLKELMVFRPVIFFSSVWNLLDVLRQTVFYACSAWYLSLCLDPLRTSLSLPLTQQENFEALASQEHKYVTLSSVGILLTILQMFKYLIPFPKVGIFVHTMVKAGSDLFNFMALLAAIMLGYAVMGHIMFGHVMHEYHTFVDAIIAVAYMSLGEFDYPSLVQASSRSAATLYFFSFVVMVPIIVLNMVIAIVFTAYDGINEIIDSTEDFDVLPHMFRHALLLRQPTFKELKQSIPTMFANRWFFKHAHHHKSKGDNRLSADEFDEHHLMDMLDPELSYRVAGALSKNIWAQLDHAVEVIREENAADDDDTNDHIGMIGDSASCTITRRGLLLLLQTLSNNSERNPRLGGRSIEPEDAAEIADLVFEAFSRSVDLAALTDASDDTANHQASLRMAAQSNTPEVSLGPASVLPATNESRPNTRPNTPSKGPSIAPLDSLPPMRVAEALPSRLRQEYVPVKAEEESAPLVFRSAKTKFRLT